MTHRSYISYRNRKYLKQRVRAKIFAPFLYGWCYRPFGFFFLFLSLLKGHSHSISEVLLAHKQLCLLSVDQAVTGQNMQATGKKKKRMVFQWWETSHLALLPLESSYSNTRETCLPGGHFFFYRSLRRARLLLRPDQGRGRTPPGPRGTAQARGEARGGQEPTL